MRSKRLRLGFWAVSNGLRGRAEKDEAGPEGRRVRWMGWPLALAPSYSFIASRAEEREV